MATNTTPRAVRQRAREHFQNAGRARGLLVAFEGPDGSGKTTQRKLFTSTLMPTFYEAGQDVTAVDDPVESYQRFIGRVIREYESLALIFNFITVDAEQSIVEQHHQIRHLFREGARRPWCEWNVDAFAEWLALSGPPR